ncbi:MAG: leucine-rich repeat domain-containing protein, partial [Ureaplasma sp.]|nr:leucine-rich repeat domain-containing protein [Ureaplasma sp.]MDE7222127.1 leucine-rich repeat domain-containing protein [Ureaplasma sp.]
PQKAAFKDCTSLNSLTFGNNNVNDFTNIGWTIINESTFENTGEFEKIKLPIYLNTIGRRAFAKSNLHAFILDQSGVINNDNKLKFIEDEAFYQCKNLMQNCALFNSPNPIFGFSSTAIESFGNRAFADSNLSYFTSCINYCESNKWIGKYSYIFFSTTKPVIFGSSVFENSLQPDYNYQQAVGTVYNCYLPIYPNWKFIGENTFKNTQASLWLNYDTVDNFTWTKDNFHTNCFGPLVTVTNKNHLQGSNGFVAWYSSSTSTVLDSTAKQILETIYPSSLYKLNVNGFKYSKQINLGGSNNSKSSVVFSW